MTRILCGQLNFGAQLAPSIKFTTKSLHCFYTATATKKGVTSKFKNVVYANIWTMDIDIIVLITVIST